MYIPRHFEISKRDESFAFIEANAFGQLISTVDGRHFSSHLPFLVNEDKTKIIAHIARQNPQHRDIAGQEVLLIFTGPHDYISPSWYSGPGVPTWNYQAVHVYGRARVFDDTGEIKEVIETLTHKYESRFDQPWQPNSI